MIIFVNCATPVVAPSLHVCRFRTHPTPSIVRIVLKIVIGIILFADFQVPFLCLHLYFFSDVLLHANQLGFDMRLK